jgi:hypothetical protein
MTNSSDEETDDPHYADRRNFYKVKKWSRDGLRVELMIYAGNNLDKASSSGPIRTIRVSA